MQFDWTINTGDIITIIFWFGIVIWAFTKIKNRINPKTDEKNVDINSKVGNK